MTTKADRRRDDEPYTRQDLRAAEEDHRWWRDYDHWLQVTGDGDQAAYWCRRAGGWVTPDE